MQEAAQSMIIDVLNLSSHEKPIGRVITVDRVLKLCWNAIEVLHNEPMLVEIDRPVRVCGDIHGQFPDLVRLFHRGGWPATANYLFLGDYIDRGRFNLETILLLLAYKVRFPKNFFLLRGHHECQSVNFTYGFHDEIYKRYPKTELYSELQKVFAELSLCGLIADSILCMHGGLSPLLKSFADIRNIRKPCGGTDGIEMELLWADPVLALSAFVVRSIGC